MQAQKLAETGREMAVERGRALVAVKRIGAHIGLKPGDMMLLDTLAAFTRSQDWQAGQRPIVWASNAYLMEQTGFSLSALKRHLRRLAEAGLIAFHDSPNGKRWGHRDAEGMIVEAYGFDLSPLAVQAEAFEQLHSDRQAERSLCQRLRRQITIARRMIRARLEAALNEALPGPWARLRGLFDALLTRLPRRTDGAEALERALGGFKALQTRVEDAYAGAVDTPVEIPVEDRMECPEKTQEMNPRETISDPHIPITNQPLSVTCNRSEKERAASGVPNARPEEQVDSALEDWVTQLREKRPMPLDLPIVMQACPEFASWARSLGGYLKNWGDLHRLAGDLRPMIGVSEQAWALAQERLGPQQATAALALVFDKHCAGEVASPGGYLRGMIEKAGAGELHLERSFFGRLSAQAA